MAKSIDQWQADIIAAKDADPVIGTGGTNPLSSTSSVSIWRLWTRIFASAAHDLDKSQDLHKAEVQMIIDRQKAHKLNWYIGKAKAYQHGDDLPADTDVYDPVRDADDAALVIDFAVGVEKDSEILIKTAKGVPGALSANSVGELTGLNAYMKRLKDAGVRVRCTSAAADTLQPAMIIHYDPLVLNSAGERIDGTATTPVKDATNTFLTNLATLAGESGNPMNGRFIIDDYITALLAVEGVKVPEISSMRAYYGAVSPALFTAWYDADAGYLAIDNVYWAANVTYQPYLP